MYEPSSGKLVDEIDFDDPDDEFVSDSKDRKRCMDLALAHYNDKNGGETSLNPILLLSQSLWVIAALILMIFFFSVPYVSSNIYLQFIGFAAHWL